MNVEHQDGDIDDLSLASVNGTNMTSLQEVAQCDPPCYQSMLTEEMTESKEDGKETLDEEEEKEMVTIVGSLPDLNVSQMKLSTAKKNTIIHY
jgi:helix-turn-helix protein